MYANYHTHTKRCGHATGEMRDYVETAIKNGMKKLGFSDHAPYFFSTDYHSGIRMDISEAKSYVEEIKGLKAEYEGKIELFTGYEMEYYPKEFEKTYSYLKELGFDYLILGQHFTNNEYDGVYVGAKADEKILKQYVKQVTDAIKTRAFSYIAHPDLVNYRDNSDIYNEQMEILCKCALKYDIPLEFNMLGQREGRLYPYDKFWKIAARVGNKVILGADSHSSDSVGMPENYIESVNVLKNIGITPIKDLKIGDK